LVELILLVDDNGLANVERDFILGFGLEVVNGPDCLGHGVLSLFTLSTGEIRRPRGLEEKETEREEGNNGD